MRAISLLRHFDIGISVAEFDVHLQSYFLETQIYADFVSGKVDIVAGDKGSGKTAIFKIVRDKYREIPSLEQVELIAGFNDAGNPVFQRLSQAKVLTEGQYITVWKSYILALIGNYLLDVCEGAFTERTRDLDHLLTAVGLRSGDSSAITIFSQLTNLLRTLTHPKSAEVKFTVSEAGMPVVTPRVEFSKISTQEDETQSIVNSDDALTLLNAAIRDLGIQMWMVLDRLDEAFAGFPAIEVPALRALFRTYLDLQAFDNIKLKLFVRNDLFRKIIRGGFVNLTHINARRVQITWYSEDLHALLCRRVRECPEFMNFLGFSDATEDQEILSVIFPPQVDIGEKKPTTWNWILTRIRDGNGNTPPRNLIDLVNKTKEAQCRREERDAREFTAQIPLLEADSIRKGLTALSDQRVQDTLLSESADYARFITAFKGGKAEHDTATVTQLIEAAGGTPEDILTELLALGFLEKVGDVFKVPMIYRSGLKITQGKAFGQQ